MPDDNPITAMVPRLAALHTASASLIRHSHQLRDRAEQAKLQAQLVQGRLALLRDRTRRDLAHLGR